jgi:hypothetical protein
MPCDLVRLLKLAKLSQNRAKAGFRGGTFTSLLGRMMLSLDSRGGEEAGRAGAGRFVPARRREIEAEG